VIYAMSILSPSVKMPQRTEQTIKQNEGRDYFSDVLSSIPASDAEELKKEICDFEKPDSDDNRDEADVMAIFCRLNQLIGSGNWDKYLTVSEEDVTGVLEGKSFLSDKDIAFLFAEAKSCFNRLSGEEKKAIMARMPQITKLFHEQNSAATGSGSGLCPLENLSEPSITSVSCNQISDHPESDIRAPKSDGAQILPGNAATEISISQSGDCTGAAHDLVENRGTMPEIRETDIEKSLQMEVAPGTGFTAETYSDAVTGETSDVIRTVADFALSKLWEIMSSFGERTSNRFEIQLEPENLGKLSISLSMSSSGLKALIRTKDSEVQSLLASEVNSLVDKLGENSVQVKSIDVIYTGAGGDNLFNQNSANTHSGQNPHAYRGNYVEVVQTAYEETTGAQYYAWVNEDVLGSTVVYRA